MQNLRKDFDRFDGRDIDVAIIRHSLITILLRIAKMQAAEHADRSIKEPRSPIYRLFVKELESSFAKEHGLQYYAKRLGYSESTVSRACVAAEGRSAKDVIDRRIVLEAQRLLVHSTASVARIAHLLGFSEATNFIKFFRRQIALTSLEFKKKVSPSNVEDDVR